MALGFACVLLAAPRSFVFAEGAPSGGTFAEAKAKALAWLEGRMVPNDTVPEPEPDRMRLLVSYEIPPSAPAYPYLSGRSMVYDDALAAVAFTMAGDYRNAAFVLNALSRLSRADGGLYFGYNTHNSWPSEEDAEGALDRTGSGAWAGYAAVFYIQKRQREEPGFLAKDREARAYLEMAKAMADCLLARVVRDGKDPRRGLATGGEGGYSLGYEAKAVVELFEPGAVDWASAEHNIDLYFLLKDLGELTGEARYLEAAADIRTALLGLWSAKDGQYYQGRKPDRIDTVLALDCASWGAMFSQAAGREDYARACLKAVEARYRSADSSPATGNRRVEGYKPYADRLLFDGAPEEVAEHYFGSAKAPTWRETEGVWGEGSLGVALACLKQGKTGKARTILEEMLKLQTPGGGLPYFTREIPHEFVSYPSVASTAWLAIAISALEDPEACSGFMGNWR